MVKIIILIFIISTGGLANEVDNKIKSGSIPEIIIPVYDQIKDMHFDIPLVVNGEPVCHIVTPFNYIKDAGLLQAAIRKLTGVEPSIIGDTDAQASVPFSGNLIILGNRSTSRVSSELYDHHYSLMDLKYPGAGGYSVRSLHNPYGNGYSAVLIGGSDMEGVSAGVSAFISELSILPVSAGNFSVGWTMLTRLGEGVEIPADIRDLVSWENSISNKGRTYGFGWNSISIRMAMYYMTGDPFHAHEFIRLSFPDARALKDIDEIDGERIENKNDPLAGPYHYNATKTILFWDMIEESPVFNDSIRLKVTNAFARRLDHEGTTPFDKNTYRLNEVPSGIGGRHGQWSAISLYTLGRYFNKYYSSPMWGQAVRAGELYFSPLKNTYWVAGDNDHLFWFTSYYEPVLDYLLYSGNRDPVMMDNLRKVLNTQEIISTGLPNDWGLRASPLSMLNKAAHILNDGRWLHYRERVNLDTDVFRIGQSYWPDSGFEAVPPNDRLNTWNFQFMPEGMWKSRGTGFSNDQSFRWGSYRNKPGPDGDYILVKGYNGAGRNPYHTYALLELRLDGATLLNGFGNQVNSSGDGMVEPEVAMDAALLHHEVVGQVVSVTGEVPDLPFVNWRRSLAQRTGKYALIVDDITFRGDNAGSDMLTRLETSWQMPAGEWIPGQHYARIHPVEKGKENIYELHTSEITDVNPGRIINMVWEGSPGRGERSTFFHLLGRSSSDGLASLRLTDNAAALSLPESALAVSGRYEGLSGELILLGENTLYGRSLQTAELGQFVFASDFPVDVDWDFESGRLSVKNTRDLTLTLSLSSGSVSTTLPAGSHEITGSELSLGVRRSLSGELQKLLHQAQHNRSQQLDREEPADRLPVEVFSPVLRGDIGGSPIMESIVIPTAGGDLIATATGNNIIILDSEGKELRRMQAADDVRVLHWWQEPGLLLAGCIDEQVIAFDLEGQKRWEFTSVMDPEVYEAGKPYWFKSAYPGIYGLYSGVFDNGRNRVFVGSACTLEILDEDGDLVKRLPVFWGPGRRFLMVDAVDGSRNLLIGRWRNGWESLAIVNSRNLEVTGSGYRGVPEGHSFISGWAVMNRYDNFLADLNGDGNREIVSAINGNWNRITIYSEQGSPLYNAQVGPGIMGERTNIRMMDIGDLNGDGKKEIVFGLSGGFLNVLDSQAQKIWSKLLPSPPTVVKVVHESEQPLIYVGCEDGSVFAINPEGEVIRKGFLNGRPSDIQVISSSKEVLTVLITDKGNIYGFRLEATH